MDCAQTAETNDNCPFPQLSWPKAALFGLGLGLQLGIMFTLLAVYFYFRAHAPSAPQTMRTTQCADAWAQWAKQTEVHREN